MVLIYMSLEKVLTFFFIEMISFSEDNLENLINFNA